MKNEELRRQPENPRMDIKDPRFAWPEIARVEPPTYNHYLERANAEVGALVTSEQLPRKNNATTGHKSVECGRMTAARAEMAGIKWIAKAILLISAMFLFARFMAGNTMVEIEKQVGMARQTNAIAEISARETRLHLEATRERIEFQIEREKAKEKLAAGARR